MTGQRLECVYTVEAAVVMSIVLMSVATGITFGFRQSRRARDDFNTHTRALRNSHLEKLWSDEEEYGSGGRNTSDDTSDADDAGDGEEGISVSVGEYDPESFLRLVDSAEEVLEKYKETSGGEGAEDGGENADGGTGDEGIGDAGAGADLPEVPAAEVTE